MKEIRSLGIKSTGYIDKRYGKEHTATFSIFECPICKKEYELKRSRGLKQKTCVSCRGTQKITHGKTGSREYYIWQGMFQRCNNPNNKKYPIYGGKSITIGEKWDTFEGFWEDMSEGYTPEMTIDRIDSNKGYTKANCRWVTKSRNSSETTKKRPVIQYRQVLIPTKSWVKVRDWESAKQAGDELGLVPAHITAVCKNQRKTHGGFHWQYT